MLHKLLARRGWTGPLLALPLAAVLTISLAAGTDASASTGSHPSITALHVSPGALPSWGGRVHVTSTIKDAESCQLDLVSRPVGTTVVYSHKAVTACRHYSGDIVIGATAAAKAVTVGFKLAARNGGYATSVKFSVVLAAVPTTTTTTVGGVRKVAVTPTTAIAGVDTAFSVTFTATATLSGSTSGTATITLTPSATLGGTTPTGVALAVPLVDGASPCVQAGANGGTVTALAVTIDLATDCNIPAGVEVDVDLTASVPTVSAFYFAVTTSENTVAEPSNDVSVHPAPALQVTPVKRGFLASYTVTGVDAPGANGGSWSSNPDFSPATQLELVAVATNGSGATVWYSGGLDAVYYTAPGGGTMADTVTEDFPTNASANGVIFDLASAIPVGDVVTVVAGGFNPRQPVTDEITVQPGTGTGGAFVGEAPVETTTNTVTFGTSVTNVSVAPAPPFSGVSATYTVTFRASSAVPSGGDIFFSEVAGPTDFATANGVLVSDVTAGWHFVTSGTPTGPGTVEIPTVNGDQISAGDSITVTLAGVTNPPADTYTDFDVWTSEDEVPVAAPAYTISAAA